MVNNNSSFSQLATLVVFAFLFLLFGAFSAPTMNNNNNNNSSSSSSSTSHSYGTASRTSVQSSSAFKTTTRKKSALSTGESKNLASDLPRVTRQTTREALRRAEMDPLSLMRAWYLFDHRNARRAPPSVPGSTGLAIRRAKEQPADLVLAWHLLDRPMPSICPVASTLTPRSSPAPARSFQELEAENTRLKATIDGLQKEMDVLKLKNARLAKARSTTSANLPVSSPVAPSSPRPSALSSYNRTPIPTPFVQPTSRPLQEQLREQREKGKENGPPPYSPTMPSRVGRQGNATIQALSPIRPRLLFPAAESSAAAAARAPVGSTVAAATSSQAARSPVASTSSAAFSAPVRHRQTAPSPAAASPSGSSSASRKRSSPSSAASESKRLRTDGSTSPRARIPAAQVASPTEQDAILARRLQQEDDESALAWGLYLSRKG